MTHCGVLWLVAAGWEGDGSVRGKVGWCGGVPARMIATCPENDISIS